MQHSKLFLVVLALLTLIGTGCASMFLRSSSPKPRSPEEHHVFSEDWYAQARVDEANGLLPHPFTPEQIRAGCPDGHWSIIRVTSPEMDQFQKWHFLEGDEVGTTIRMEELDADGKVIHVGESGRETWENLKNHATFPVKGARFIKHRQESTALGELDCMVYEMLEPQSGVVKTRFVFAYDFPGPPILFTQYADGAEAMRFEMIDRKGWGEK